MPYEIETTNIFEKWFSGIKDKKYQARILVRIKRMQFGHFGDHKAIDPGLFEWRLFFGPGFRVYYTIRGNTVVLLLTGGDKSSQKKDIQKARAIMEDLA